MPDHNEGVSRVSTTISSNNPTSTSDADTTSSIASLNGNSALVHGRLSALTQAAANETVDHNSNCNIDVNSNENPLPSEQSPRNQSVHTVNLPRNATQPATGHFSSTMNINLPTNSASSLLSFWGNNNNLTANQQLLDSLRIKLQIESIVQEHQHQLQLQYLQQQQQHQFHLPLDINTNQELLRQLAVRNAMFPHLAELPVSSTASGSESRNLDLRGGYPTNLHGVTMPTQQQQNADTFRFSTLAQQQRHYPEANPFNTASSITVATTQPLPTNSVSQSHQNGTTVQSSQGNGSRSDVRTARMPQTDNTSLDVAAAKHDAGTVASSQSESNSSLEDSKPQKRDGADQDMDEKVPASEYYSMYLQTRNKKDRKWLANLKELKEYQRQHGDCIVPRGYEINPRLGNWVAEQRKQYNLYQDGKPSCMTPERIALLNEIGFSWNAQAAAWRRHMNDLKLFMREHNHCNVPMNDPKYPKLGLWVKEKRRHYVLMNQGKRSLMTPERAKELEGVGFNWDVHVAIWYERYNELKAFKEKHGHCSVPSSYADNPRLATWTRQVRRHYHEFQYKKQRREDARRNDDEESDDAEHSDDKSLKERFQLLEDLGFDWESDRNTYFERDEEESDRKVSARRESADQPSHSAETNTPDSASRKKKRKRPAK